MTSRLLTILTALLAIFATWTVLSLVMLNVVSHHAPSPAHANPISSEGHGVSP